MMCEAKRKQEWRKVAVQTIVIANAFRGGKPPRMADFPYCEEYKRVYRQATETEIKAFAAAWSN